MLRAVTLIIVGLVTAAWLWIVVIAVLTNLGAEESGFAVALALAPSIPALAFALPALVLALRRRLPGLALGLALASLVSVVLVA